MNKTVQKANIRPAVPGDAARLAEIELFNYRLNFYPIFRTDDYFFSELTVPVLIAEYGEKPELIAHTFVYDDGVIKGFARINGSEIEKLFVEPVFQGGGLGTALLRFAVLERGADRLWALEKNERAIAFYSRHGFYPTGEKKPVDDTDEFLIMLKWWD